MIRVLLCHASQDASAALALAARLELCAEASVSLVATQPAAPDLLHLWDDEDADAVLLLLAPECVPPQSSRAAWQPVLDQLERRARPDIGAIALRPCAYPLLLERAAFFRSGLEAPHLRALAAWLLNLHPDPGWPEWALFHPARPARAAGHEPELARLWSELADAPGCLVLDAASAPLLAQAFVREAAGQFRATLRLDAFRRPPECVAGELASSLGVRLQGTLEEAWRQLAAVLAAHRLLLILDGWEGELPWPPAATGRSSILILPPPALPAAAPDPEPPLWPAALACRPAGFPLALAARLATLAWDEALAQARLLCQQGLLAEIDPVTFRYRRLASGDVSHETRLRHAQAVGEIFLDRDSGAQLAALCAAELSDALDFAVTADWGLAIRLAGRAHLLFEHSDRRLEAVHYLRRIIQAAVVRGDEDNARHFRKKLAWLVDDSGAVHTRWHEGDQGSLFG
jgi:hypothetical protein